MPRSRSRPRAAPALLLALASLAAGCGAPTYVVTIRTEPSASDIYVNGRHVGQGPVKQVEFDFSECDRVYLQVACKGRSPSLDIFTVSTLPPEMEKRVTLR